MEIVSYDIATHGVCPDCLAVLKVVEETMITSQERNPWTGDIDITKTKCYKLIFIKHEA